MANLKNGSENSNIEINENLGLFKKYLFTFKCHFCLFNKNYRNKKLKPLFLHVFNYMYHIQHIKIFVNVLHIKNNYLVNHNFSNFNVLFRNSQSFFNSNSYPI